MYIIPPLLTVLQQSQSHAVCNKTNCPHIIIRHDNSQKSGHDLTKCPCRLSGCICPWTDFSRSMSCPQGYQQHSHQFSRRVVPTSPIQSTRIQWLYLYTPRRGYILMSQRNRSKSTRAYRSCPSKFFKFRLR